MTHGHNFQSQVIVNARTSTVVRNTSSSAPDRIVSHSIGDPKIEGSSRQGVESVRFLLFTPNEL